VALDSSLFPPSAVSPITHQLIRPCGALDCVAEPRHAADLSRVKNSQGAGCVIPLNSPMSTSRRRSSAPTALRFLSTLTGGGGPARRQRRAPRYAGRVSRQAPAHAGRRVKRGAAGLRTWLWQRLRGPLRVTVALAVLGLLNVYVLYWRRGTSMPALWDLASAGRRASLGAHLHGPVGSPPVPSQRVKKNHALPPLPDYPRVVDIALKPGDTVHSVLLAAGQSGRVLSELETSLQSLLDPGGLGAGQTLTLYYDGEERLSAVDYRLTPALAYHLERVPTGGAERFVSTRQPDTLAVRVVAVQATLAQPADFAGALVRAGETPALAARVAELFACELNLYSELHAGDRVRVVVEKHTLGSRFYRYGRLLAAEYVPAPGGPRTTRLRAFLSPSSSASNAGAGLGTAPLYYTENGESLARALCRSPLQWSRVATLPGPPGAHQPVPSVDLTQLRPQLHNERGRLGLDYAAPLGTPVLAAGAGKIVSHVGHGPQGNTVVIAHAGGIETSYQHLGRFARGLTDGQTVRLRQIVGYVGQSGQAPKPHLHLGVRVASKLVDPSRLKSPREAPLAENKRAGFAQLVAETSELLAHVGEPAGVVAVRALDDQLAQ